MAFKTTAKQTVSGVGTDLTHEATDPPNTHLQYNGRDVPTDHVKENATLLGKKSCAVLYRIRKRYFCYL
jgi:hypothetical protein